MSNVNAAFVALVENNATGMALMRREREKERKKERKKERERKRERKRKKDRKKERKKERERGLSSLLFLELLHD